MSLEKYNQKRNFARTPEPKGRVEPENRHLFVVQEHHASRLHFDFRLEMDGVLKSWAVPKGPSMDPGQKRLAVEVEDHPVSYANFEGQIADGNYGAGQVVIWDRGTYEPVNSENPLESLKEGKLTIRLHGSRLKGQFSLVRMRRGKDDWLLIKGQDSFSEPGWSLEPVLKEEKAPTRSRTTAGRAQRTTRGATSRHAARPRTRPANVVTVTLPEAVQLPHPHGDIAVTTPQGTVLLTHLEKVYWPTEGYTKGDLLQYYMKIADHIIPYLQDRPLILKRFPNGIEGPFFFQHEMEQAPEFLRTVRLQAEGGRSIDYAVIDNIASLLYLTNLGTIEEHPWHSRVQQIDHPDWMVFDLDPFEASFRTVCEVALALRDALRKLGLVSYAKTSGSRGIHVLVPLEPKYSYKEVARLARDTARQIARENTNCATVERSITKREKGKVYVDHLQNAEGKTIAAPYCARARPGAPVSTPLEWEETSRGVEPRAFTIQSIPARLREKGDLFRGVLDQRQSLNTAPASSSRERKS